MQVAGHALHQEEITHWQGGVRVGVASPLLVNAQEIPDIQHIARTDMLEERYARGWRSKSGQIQAQDRPVELAGVPPLIFLFVQEVGPRQCIRGTGKLFGLCAERGGGE
jgi:hypothetical protein